MTNSVMIEIDEATKGIMEDLQSSITNNIEFSISAGFRQKNDEQVQLLTSLQTTITSKINQIEADIAATKKPVSRISRDLEDTLLLVDKLDKGLDVKLKNIEQVQTKNILQLNKDILHATEESRHNQQKVLNESLQNFSTNTNTAMFGILEQVKDSNQSFIHLISETKEKLVEQYNTLMEKVQQEMKASTKEMLSIKENIDDSIVKQHEKFQSIQGVIEQSIAAANVQQTIRFDGHMKNTVQVFMQAVEELKIAHSEDLSKMNTLQQQNFESITARLLEVNATVTEQLLKTNEKLEALHQEVAYKNLPFYRKWFPRKESAQ